MSTSKSVSSSSEDDNELRRGPWTLEEDNLLSQYISSHGEGRWNLLAKRSGNLTTTQQVKYINERLPCSFILILSILMLINFLSFLWIRIKANWEKLQIKVAKLSKARCKTGKFNPTRATYNPRTPLKVGKQVLILCIWFLSSTGFKLWSRLCLQSAFYRDFFVLWEIVDKCDQCSLETVTKTLKALRSRPKSWSHTVF